MKVFISHNKADKNSARMLAIGLAEQGIDVWFDGWELRPGDSITGGIEKGLSDADVFALVWSEHAQKSNWVGTELSAYLRRRVDDRSLRIVPIMLDGTPLPTLVADYLGFRVGNDAEMLGVAEKMAGQKDNRELALRLQERFLELTDGIARGGDPFPYRVCPKCGSPRLKRFEYTDYKRDDQYLCIECEECHWDDSTEI